MATLIVIKQLHIALAIASIGFFILRFLGRQLEAGFIQSRPVKVLPHIVDTLLLASGITLASLYRLSPLEAHWLLAKLLLILAYIGAGFGAMKAPRFARRNAFGLLALLLFGGVVAMARLKPF